MIRLYLIRHGETEWNMANRYQGKTDIGLSEKGRQQASLLSERMKKIQLDAIYTSDLSRAKDTAMEIAKDQKCKVMEMPQLREIDFGEWEGYTTAQLAEIYGDAFTKYLEEPHKTSFPGEGSFGKVQLRVDKALKEITDHHQEGNIAVVAHGAVLKIAILSLLRIEFDAFKRFWLGNTSITVIDIKENGNVLMSLNDTHHLEEY